MEQTLDKVYNNIQNNIEDVIRSMVYCYNQENESEVSIDDLDLNELIGEVLGMIECQIEQSDY